MRRSPCSSPTRRGTTWPSNLAACLMLGYTRDELLGLKMTQVARYEAAAGEFEELMDTGTKLGVSQLTRKDGTNVRFSYVAGATVVAGMSVFVAVGAVVECRVNARALVAGGSTRPARRVGLNVDPAMPYARPERPAWSEPSPRARSSTSSL